MLRPSNIPGACLGLAVLAGLLLAPAARAQAPAPNPAEAQKPGERPVDRDGVPTFSVETRLVVLHATVLDNNKHMVTDLQKEHFKVYDNDVEQQIRQFKREDIPVSVGILVDNSGSMRDKRRKVNAAALTFVRTSNPADEVFIVNFNDEAFLDKDFTSNIEDLKDGLEKIDSRGGTAYYDAIQMSIDHLKQGARRSKKVLLVVTDGEDNASRMNLEELVTLSHRSEVVIYTVGLLSEQNRRAAKRAKRAMENISEATGGLAFFPDNADEVEGIAARIAHDIRNQYVLTFTPTNPGRQGDFHSLKVQAKAPGKGKLLVRTRTGYYTDRVAAGSSASNRGGE